MRAARRHGREALVFAQLRQPGDVAEGREVARRDRGDQQVAIERPHRPVGRARRGDRELRFLQLVDQQVQHAVHQSDVDLLAASGARALHERGLDRREGEDAAEHVCHEHRAAGGPIAIAGIAGERGVEAARRVDDHGVCGAAGGRAGLAIPGDRAVDETGVERAERLGAEAEAIHHAGAEVLHHHIGFGDKALHQRDRLRILQIEREAAFAGIELPEVGAVAGAQGGAHAHVVAFGRFDLDDIGAEVGEQARAVRAGQHDREVEDADAIQRIRLRRDGARHRPAPACAAVVRRRAATAAGRRARGSSSRCTDARCERIRRVA